MNCYVGRRQYLAMVGSRQYLRARTILNLEIKKVKTNKAKTDFGQHLFYVAFKKCPNCIEQNDGDYPESLQSFP